MKVRFTPLLLVFLLFLMAGSPAAAQDQKSPTFVDKVDVSDEVVTFQTHEGNYVDFTLNVSGPDNFRLQKSFTGKDTPVLSITTEQGVTLPDGSYTLEMTARPAISDKQRAALDKARQKGDRYQVGRLMKEMGINPQGMVHSLYLSVAEGKFINPYGEEALPGPADVKMGSLEGAPSQGATQTFDSVSLTGQRWDAAYLPATPDATGANAQQAMLVSGNNAAPFARTAEAPTWYEATFQNTADDGTPVAYHGYLRPLAYDGQGKLFQAYYRSADSPVDDTWFRGYFLAENGTIRFLTQAEITGAAQAAPLFDYVSEDDPTGNAPDAALPDQVILDDLIVDGSACIGQDCVNGESFGFDTIRIKENNLRIKAQDTSSTASFPTQDWQITFNDSSNGGANKFSIDAISPVSNTPFTIEAGAPSHSLYVDDGGRIGLGTSTPVADLHVKTGNTPTLRLEQDGTSGFTPQTWDVAGNEANFFIRDATSGSTLPFRVFPGAPSNALTIEGTTGDIGIGTTSPQAPIHVANAASGNADDVVITENGSIGIGTTNPVATVHLRIVDTAPQIQLNETDVPATFSLISNGGNFQFRKTDNASALTVNHSTGLVTVPNNLTVTGTVSKGGGSFKIDHPLDPANKFLYHSFVESPDMMNVYNGNARLNAQGEVIVEMPDYFEALNQDFRYQLTSIGAPGPNLYIAREIDGNRFVIAGGEPGATVSWQVTGIRHDPFAVQNRIQVEVDKPAAIRGLYLHPTEYNLPMERSIYYEPLEVEQVNQGGGQ